MKKLLSITIAFLGLLPGRQVIAQDQEKPEPSISLRYFNHDGLLQYLKVKAMIKEENKLQPLPGTLIQIYLGESLPENLVAKTRTDEKGESKIIIPVSLKDKWNESSIHHFIAVAEATKKYAEATSELDISRAKIEIDTLNEEGARKVAVRLFSFDSSGWVPVKDVELKIGVRRLGGDLKIGEDETYTTDSLGQAIGEFKLDKLPAIDVKNNIVLVVKTEDNEQFGNLSFEKTVSWGHWVKYQNDDFNRRSLWATREKAPVWLLFMAGSIVAGVWGVLIYLVFQLVKIKRAGKASERNSQAIVAAAEVIQA